MEQGNLSLPGESRDWLAHATENARARADEAKVAATRASRALTELETLCRHRDRGWWFHIRAQLARGSKTRQAMVASDPDIENRLAKLLEEAEVRTRELMLDFPRDMERIASIRGLPLDVESSRHPVYKFRDGFFEVRVDERRLVARVSDYEESLKTLPPDVEAIAEVLQSEDSRVFARPFDGKRFLKKLRRAYLAALKSAGEADGAPAPVRDIAGRMARTGRGPRRDEFLVDLSRLVEQGPPAVQGMRFELQQTRDLHKGMLLLGQAGSGMVSLLVFRKEHAP